MKMITRANCISSGNVAVSWNMGMQSSSWIVRPERLFSHGCFSRDWGQWPLCMLTGADENWLVLWSEMGSHTEPSSRFRRWKLFFGQMHWLICKTGLVIVFDLEVGIIGVVWITLVGGLCKIVDVVLSGAIGGTNRSYWWDKHNDGERAWCWSKTIWRWLLG